MTLNLHVVTPTKVVWDAPTPEIILPTTNGQIGILPGHVSIVTFLQVGVIRVRFEKDWLPIFVMGGFAEVEADEVTVVVNGAERGDEIDCAMADSALETARESLHSAQSRPEKTRAQQAIARARARAIAAHDFPQQLIGRVPVGTGSTRKNPKVSAMKTIEKL
ncbi:ATP synthase F1 subunit epsilon [Phormidium sp. CCY1219]|uniref:ATP synthase F1 subunit epsilon n=1 Tax=Phormidium sp. CCY1219 TaxID=2886104 RepID=UPI002D77ED26|nr:ATP synthase F1 subunit epsilon [Phormidium sp. CCY1219]